MALVREILVNITGGEQRVATLLNGELQALEIERRSEAFRKGTICLARVVRIVPGMQAAFMDIGRQKNGFLHVTDVRRNEVALAADQAQLPIQKLLHDGQTFPVQVLQDERGDKGARLSMDLCIADSLLVLKPQSCGVSISNKISDASEQSRLFNLLSAALALETDSLGLIARTRAAQANDTQLKQQLALVLSQWRQIELQCSTVQVGTPLWQEPDLLQRSLRRAADGVSTLVRIDSQTVYMDTQQWLSNQAGMNNVTVDMYASPTAVFDLYDTEQKLNGLLLREVPLPSGASMVIDNTEALVVVDVNSAANLGRANPDVLLQSNLEAAEELVRQLRLRNIGGIIVVDFINLDSTDARQTLLSTLNQHLKSDGSCSTAQRISPLGLVEFSRRHQGPPLQRQLCQPCTACGSPNGTPQRNSLTILFDIMRAVVKVSIDGNNPATTLHAHPVIIEMLKTSESKSLEEIENLIGQSLSLEADAALARDDYRIK
ncbi:MAG: Rne/Rng family ribonuclease [Gammaproteobacteria bacterium]|nr:Rne/Rng family ribonuclease [Gammaproteobacteria bacterium]